MKKLIKDPLCHFLIIGAALFLIFDIVQDPGDSSLNTITINTADIKVIKADFARRWQRPASEEELSALITEFARNEMAYREALALGLDQDDPIIKRRLRSKLDLIVEDMARLSPPSNQDLTKFLDENSDRYKVQPRISFRQIYFNPESRGEQTTADIAAALDKLKSSPTQQDILTIGDATMLPAQLELTPITLISRQFGQMFSKSLLEIAPETWIGPVGSGYGLHLVYVEKQVAGYLPPLSEIREAVERDWTYQHRDNVLRDAYRLLAEQYRVIIETDPANPQEWTAEAAQ
ncbi:MAG: peptidyl-prolyl cis-trans isomerase [Desulfobacterales bacterium]|nr:peptidyl-prolyl cis-trans isomerase [Deltaproteobacteria bacterium]NNK93662.1 peptidyl-prolyl cis-trans isomerase [Desulfobacterales bacterium]